MGYVDKYKGVIVFEIGFCNLCIQSRSILVKLKKVAPEANFQIGCQSFCGPGRGKYFVFIDGKPILSEYEKELIEKVKEYVD